MKVWVDDQACELDGPTSVEALLERLGRAPASVAVAVNGCFVPRARRPQHLLAEGDRVACFQPIVGG